MTRSPTVDAPIVATQRGMAMRTLNSVMWGRGGGRQGHDGRSTSDPVKLGGCGRAYNTTQWVPIHDVDGHWSPAGIASCDNALLCDACGARVQAESAARFRWHFEDWMAGGGQLLHVRLSFAHTKGDDVATLLADLQRGFTLLRESPAWRRHGIVDWVRVLHVRWSPTNGFYPHYHVTAFVRPGHHLDEVQALTELQGAWRDRVASRVGRRVARSHGLFARVFASPLRAMYAWVEDWRDDHDDERPDVHSDDLGPDYEPRHLDDTDDRSWPLYRLAEAALDGDQAAWAAWAELCRAMKGKPVVRASKMLDRVWRDHQTTTEPAAVEVLEAEPVALVASGLWEKARRRGVAEMGLALGSTHGVEAMALWWHQQLGVKVRLELSDFGPARLSARDGPPGVPSPSLH